MSKNRNSIYNELYDVFYEEFAKLILNCFQSHFSDFDLEITDNVAILLIKKLNEFNSKSINSFSIMEKLFNNINQIHKLFSSFFLEYMIHKSLVFLWENN